MGTVCDPNPCSQPMGACCFPDGSCQVTTEANCQGTWQGMGTVCDPNPCPQPTGACCFQDGSCQITTQADCQGAWQGMGTVCDPNPCSQPMGACCFPDGSCQVTTEANCQGTWQGMGTDCDPNLCPPPPPCLITVTSPNGGEVWQVGSTQTITWDRSGTCGELVRIDLLWKVPVWASNVASYQICSTIATDAGNTGSYSWTVAACSGLGVNQYKILITDLSSGASDMSNQPFSITTQALARGGLNFSRVLVTTPFRPDGQIYFNMSEPGPVRVAIFNVHGQKVRDLVDRNYPAGEFQVSWDARTDVGDEAVAGIYYLRIRLDGSQINRKLVLVR
jgi:hypothetical protein